MLLFCILESSDDLDKVEAKLRSIIRTCKKRGIPVGDLFRKYDPDTTHYITGKQFRAVMKDIGFPLTNAEIVVTMDRFDEMNDGSVNYKELIEMSEAGTQLTINSSALAPELLSGV